MEGEVRQEEVVCLFHGDCFDGMGAAWAVHRKFPDARFVAVDYNDPYPEGLEGKHVIIVDFSYDLPVMREIIGIAKYVTFLDHHLRSEGICAALLEDGHANLHAEYVVDNSGAVMAWNHFHHESSCPMILKYIEDRDLWKWEMDGTNEILAGLGIYELDLEVWCEILNPINHTDPRQVNKFLENLQMAGMTVAIKNRTEINRLIKQTLRHIDFAGYKNVPVINAPRSLSSEALAHIAKEHPFAIAYFDCDKHRIFSLRSCKKNGVPVAPLAELYDGGGHTHAAGFRVTREHPLAQF